MAVPDRKPDVHEVLTDMQLGEAIVLWLQSKGRLSADAVTWHAMQTVHDVSGKVVHAKLWKEP